MTSRRNEQSGGFLPVVSLFSGAGGLDMAVERAAEPALIPDGAGSPAKIAVATDYDNDAVASFRMNHDAPCIKGDIRQISTGQLLEAGGLVAGDPVLVVGGPPCTPFSKSGFWLDYKRESRDPNASLLDEFVRVVRESRPEAFILENVQGLTYKTHAAQLTRLRAQLRELGYAPQVQVLNAADFGVPQLRKRVFVVGRRDGRRFQFPEATHSGWSERNHDIDEQKRPYVTASTAFASLPESGEIDELVEGEFAELLARVPPGENYLWHTDRAGKGGDNRFKWRSRYWTFLLRLDPDRPATTIQAQPGPWVGPFHWENLSNADGQPRARRLRRSEVLALMTFPQDFKFGSDSTRREVQKLLGNAVPVELGKVVVRALLEQLGHLKVTAEAERRSA